MAQERSMRTTSVPSIVYLLSNENNTIVARSVSLISNLSQNNRVVGDAFVKGKKKKNLQQKIFNFFLFGFCFWTKVELWRNYIKP